MSDHPLAAALDSGLADLGLDLSAGQRGQALAYLDLIARWNQVYNLTAIRDPQAMLTQHLLDCLAVVAPLRRQAATMGLDGEAVRLLDVGSGAGLPGVVLAITNPAWTVVCVDTVAKKASFIRQVAAELGLARLSAEHQRVERMSAQFPLISSRAFASLADFVNLSRDRLAPGGCWMAMKARLTPEEREAVPADVELFHVEPLVVPGLDAERCLVWLRRRSA
jgi:16S rRNA (guanine527-N7)-methyltransferase